MLIFNITCIYSEGVYGV